MLKSLVLRAFCACLAVGLASLFTASSALAHQFHTSVAELDWNEASGRWEVSLRIHGNDLELAVEKQFGKKRDIESSQATDWIERYVEARFKIVPKESAEKLTAALESPAEDSSSGSNSSQLEWVGQEVEGGWMWLYFELIPTKYESEMALVSQILTDVNEDQINIVSIRNASKKRSTQQTSRKQVWIRM